jgi:hypothetical protein
VGAAAATAVGDAVAMGVGEAGATASAATAGGGAGARASAASGPAADTGSRAGDGRLSQAMRPAMYRVPSALATRSASLAPG